ncbi:homeobox-leucine zipper protein HAT14-like [Tasmannia lanceolata]|uniref:homeobox-leucine zipper protein HAT14-like n=1 Tax=Tasmannia lanceolata TaxID=3420 RepID=UPI0040635E57
MEEEGSCNTGLVLGIGRGNFSDESRRDRQRKTPIQFHILFPTTTINEEHDVDRSSSKTTDEDDDEEDANRNTHKIENNNTRKKLRLTKEQSTLLEDSFREHTTLTQAQKQELADQLNLRPRQVEVWFQNRRARTKLKQTEVDCVFLKKCCESLSDENRRLEKELQELRSTKLGSPFYIQLPKGSTTSMTMCPSCEMITSSDGKNSKSTAPLKIPPWHVKSS